MQIDRERFDAACRRIDRPRAWVARRVGITRQALQHYMDGRPIAQGLYLKLVAALGTDDFVTSNPTVRKPDPALSGWLTHPATVAHALTVGQQQGEAA